MKYKVVGRNEKSDYIILDEEEDLIIATFPWAMLFDGDESKLQLANEICKMLNSGDLVVI